ncbi:hypothetical protein FHL15_010834 [Xylaria flabelliformis]|uniref:CDP-diacylglycerol--glycerol-3-phosphate 3-phosphatidyltransferase n=1 Tax=Xylaria flabelliformis TaxID=2512241 RepID=A0A553HJZ5_9PEZI|nr:hypothetical protein FHL15_010834 [Xylaria flabelliformis]
MPRQAPQYTRQCRRRYSMPSSPAPVGSSTSSVGMLAPFTNELDRLAPSFKINGSQIQIIKSPTDFYETLKVAWSRLCDNARMANMAKSGQDTTGKQAYLPIYFIHRQIGERTGKIPTDLDRHRVEIRMYHTPNLTGLRKKHIPKRINEGWGLQHMKLYGVDDEIILSGANLSNDYFTNRQDRYHLFASRDVTDYFWRLYQGVTSLSFLVEPTQEAAGFRLHWPSKNAAPSPLEQPANYVAQSTKIISKLISLGDDKPGMPALDHSSSSKDTTVYMLGQLSQLMRPDTSTELPVVIHVLKTLARPEYSGSSWTFTAGYFNPDPTLRNLLLSTASDGNTVITAHPHANGFYGSKGVSGLLPGAYTYLARRFLREVHQRKRDSSIVLKEWRKGMVGEPEGWTYHAKGLWITLPNEKDPSMSIIGSSNYTKRSYSHDLEAGALIVTRDEDLKKRLGAEQRWLQDFAKPVTLDDFATNERRVGLNVRIAMWIVSLVGGAL